MTSIGATLVVIGILGFALFILFAKLYVVLSTSTIALESAYQLGQYASKADLFFPISELANIMKVVITLLLTLFVIKFTMFSIKFIRGSGSTI